MRKKWILLGIYSILLCMVVSFAWIFDQNKYPAKYVFFGYGDTKEDTNGKLVIAPTDVEMTLYVLKDGIWRTAASSTDKKAQSKLFVVEPQKVIPDANIPFRIRFKNKTDEKVTVKLTMSGVVCDKALTPSDKDILFVGALGSMEYSKYPDVKQPESIYLPITDGSLVATNEQKNTNTYEFVLYDDIEVPVMADGEYVEIDCYFYFDSEAMTNSCQNKTFYVTSFRAVQE